jgi:hypothetical protein
VRERRRALRSVSAPPDLAASIVIAGVTMQ